MNEKRYFNEIKKEICLRKLFSKLYNYFSTKSPALQYTSANVALVFEIRPLQNGVLFLKSSLTADFTSSSQLKRWSFKRSFSFGNRRKSLGARSGLYGGCGSTEKSRH